jgi:CheY-like chemotaxis protein
LQTFRAKKATSRRHHPENGILASMEPELAREQFAHHVQRALAALYDPVVLSNSVLVKVLPIDNQRDATTALRRILVGAIESLKPDEPAPPGSRSWRVYQVLRKRYTEQLTQHEVALDLGLSIRQLQREEKLAREMLADRLWTAYRLDAKVHLLTLHRSYYQNHHSNAYRLDAKLHLLTPSGSQNEPHAAQDSLAPSAAQEMEALSSSTPAQLVEIGAVIQEVLETLRPLVLASRTSIDYCEDGELPPIFVKPPMLRQALLNLASVALQHAFEGNLRMHAYRDAAQLRVDLHATGSAGMAPTREDESGETLEMAGQLLRFCDGSLEVTSAEPGEPRQDDARPQVFAACIQLPVAEIHTVLVIDDNADARHLLQRYLSGTPYQFVGAQDAKQALALVEQINPNAVILDVMMPGQDGWSLLGQLREHPRLHGAPILVSTILPQKELAFALGAAEFIRKPIKRAELLEALARHLAPSTESGR